MRWVRRLLLVVAIVLCAVLAAAVFAYFQYRATPDWYRADTMTEQQRKQAANSADQKLADLFSWSAAVQASAVRQIRGDSSQPAPEPKTVTLTESELNAFATAWQGSDNNPIEQKLTRYFSDGRLVLADGRIIFAATSRDLGAVVSVQLLPTVDEQGQLRLQWQGVSVGDLAIPHALISGRLRGLTDQLQDQMSRYQQSAQIDQTLTANSSAVQAMVTRWLLDALSGQASDPTAFVPFDVGDFQQAQAVRLTSVQVTDGSLTLGLAPLSLQDRSSILSRLKEPYAAPSP